jgi:hypothetical protein
MDKPNTLKMHTFMFGEGYTCIHIKEAEKQLFTSVWCGVGREHRLLEIENKTKL